MSFSSWYVKNHCKVNFNVDHQKERDLDERRSMFDAYMSGMSLPEILDKHYLEPKYKLLKREGRLSPHMIFDKDCIDEGRAERPCVDNSIMYYEKGCDSVVSIEYDKNEFHNQMERYWGK